MTCLATELLATPVGVRATGNRQRRRVPVAVRQWAGTVPYEHGGATTLRSLEDAVPPLTSCLLNPAWSQFVALLPDRPAAAPTHPLGCHRRRIPDRVVFEHVVAALVHGSGSERLATPGCSDRTTRRRVKEWAADGLTEVLQTLALQQYDRMIGIEAEDVTVDGYITKAPAAGRRPVALPWTRANGAQAVDRNRRLWGAPQSRPRRSQPP